MIEQDTRTRFILAPASEFRYGACVYKHKLNGWIFVPNVNNRRASRKVWSTPEACIPRWAKPHRLVLHIPKEELK